MNIIQNFDLYEYNSYSIRSSCSSAFFPKTEEQLIEYFKERMNSKIILFGNGNNVILSKSYYKEDFIILNGCFDLVHVNGKDIIAEAGATMRKLSELALKRSLSGFEVFYDIPSSAGGAVVMNAGSGKEEIKNLVTKVRYLDLTDLQIKEIASYDCEFEYRNSLFQKYSDKIVLKIWFRLESMNSKLIRKKMDSIKETRRTKQPREYPNCGSVFKRPKGYYVGTMIEELGLKGYKIGGAMISDKHAGFIVNYNNATGQDIIELINYTKGRVFDEYGIELEVEQRII